MEVDARRGQVNAPRGRAGGPRVVVGSGPVEVIAGGVRGGRVEVELDGHAPGDVLVAQAAPAAAHGRQPGVLDGEGEAVALRGGAPEVEDGREFADVLLRVEPGGVGGVGNGVGDAQDVTDDRGRAGGVTLALGGEQRGGVREAVGEVHRGRDAAGGGGGVGVGGGADEVDGADPEVVGRVELQAVDGAGDGVGGRGGPRGRGEVVGVGGDVNLVAGFVVGGVGPEQVNLAAGNRLREEAEGLGGRAGILAEHAVADQGAGAGGFAGAAEDVTVGDGGDAELDGVAEAVAVVGGLAAGVELGGEVAGGVGAQLAVAAVDHPGDAVGGRAAGRDRGRGAEAAEGVRRDRGGRCGEDAVGDGEGPADIVLVGADVEELAVEIRRRVQRADDGVGGRDLDHPIAGGHESAVGARAGGPAAELAQVVPVQEVNPALLAGGDEQVRVRGAAHAVRQDHHAAGTQVGVAAAQVLLVVGGEVVGHPQAPAVDVGAGGGGGGVHDELEDGVPVVAPDRETVGVKVAHDLGAVVGERAVAGGNVERPGGIGGHAAAGHPDAAVRTVGRGVEHGPQRQRRGVVAQHPAVVGTVVTVGGEGQVNPAAGQREGGALVFAMNVEVDAAVDRPVPGAGDGRAAGVGVGPGVGARVEHAGVLGDEHGAAAALGAAGGVNGVQPKVVVPYPADDQAALGGDVEVALAVGVGGGVNDGRAGDADLGVSVHAAGDVLPVALGGGGHRGLAAGRVDEAEFPELRAADRVNRIDAVVLRGDEGGAVGRPRVGAGGNGHVGDVEGLGVELAVHRRGEDLAEAVGVDQRGRELLLVEVLAGAGEVVAVVQNADLRAERTWGRQPGKGGAKRHERKAAARAWGSHDEEYCPNPAEAAGGKPSAEAGSRKQTPPGGIQPAGGSEGFFGSARHVGRSDGAEGGTQGRRGAHTSTLSIAGWSVTSNISPLGTMVILPNAWSRSR